MKLEYKEIASQTPENPKGLVFLLHGLGDDAEGSFPLARHFAEQLPGTHILVPEAPGQIGDDLPKIALYLLKKQKNMNAEKIAAMQQQKSWFSVNPFTISLRIKFSQVAAIHPLNQLIDEKLKQTGLNSTRLVLFGFSQGGTIATMAAMEREEPCAGIVGHSVFLPATFRATSNPPVTLIIGENEMNSRRLSRFGWAPDDTIKRLKKMGTNPETIIIPNLGHRTSQDSIDQSTKAIARYLNLEKA